MAEDMDELDHELDPDLMLDMPDQQIDGMFGSSISDEFGFQHEGLSASDLGAGFGNIKQSDLSLLDGFTDSTQQAPFSLADELADALDGHEHEDSDRVLAELDLDSGHHELLSSIQSSPMRVAKSSRATMASSATETDIDENATNAEFEEQTHLLQTLLQELETSSQAIETLNHSTTHGSAEMEHRIEALCSGLIRSSYEHLKQNEDCMRDLRAIEQDSKASLPGWIPTHDHIEQFTSSGDIHDAHTVSDVKSSDSLELNGDAAGEDTWSFECINAVSEMRSLTEDVLSSLTSISELLQVNKASVNEHFRRLRAMETGLSRLKSENDSIQASQDLILKWQGSHLPKQTVIPGLMTPPSKLSSLDTGLSVSSSTNFGVQVREHLKSAQSLFDEASIRAVNLLTV